MPPKGKKAGGGAKKKMGAAVKKTASATAFNSGTKGKKGASSTKKLTAKG